MEPVHINIASASAEGLRAECERLLVQGVTLRTRPDTLRKKLRKHQQAYRLYWQWAQLVKLLVGESGFASRPRPMTLEVMMEWAHDIMFAQLEFGGYVGEGAKTFRDRTTGNTVRITDRQSASNVNVLVVEKEVAASGTLGSIAILHAAGSVFESIRAILDTWEHWKAGNTGPR